jgi:hypothetical protein
MWKRRNHDAAFKARVAGFRRGALACITSRTRLGVKCEHKSETKQENCPKHNV